MKKTYLVEVTATVEVTCEFEIEAINENEAEEIAETKFEDNLVCEIAGAADSISWGIESINVKAEEEE